MEIKNETKQMDYSAFTGHWENAFNTTKAIGSFDFYVRNRAAYISIKGVDKGLTPGDWGTVRANGYANATDSEKVVGLEAFFNREGQKVFLAININKGLIIIAAYIRFTDQPEKSSVFVREFFHKK